MSEIELPELPKPRYPVGTGQTLVGFARDQMREYARQAVAVERERCAKLVEAETIWNDWDQQQLAAAIRKETP